MKNIFLYRLAAYIASVLLVLCYGCKKFVQINTPNTQLVTASVFNNSASATSAVLAIYIQMFNNAESWTIAQNQGLLSDELTNHSTLVNQIQYYTNSLVPLNNPGEWVHAYSYVYQANAIIAGLQNNNQIPATVSQQLVGEAKFIRAFWQFYLTNMYGNIPIVTTTAFTVNKSLSRSLQAQVYTQITQDLQDAISLLNSNYVDATDTTITTQRVRPNKAAAEALLSRVYLYRRNYDSAEIYASSVIGQISTYHLCALNSYDSTFKVNSAEAIWQLSTPLPNTNNTIDAQSFILLGAPSSGGTAHTTTISPQLLSSFEEGDLRRDYWIDSFQVASNPGITYYFPYKYQAINTTTLSEFTMVLRLAEQYLIRAEAEAELNDLTDASDDLNKVRTRANLPNISDSIASSQTLLLGAILHERQVELFTEWGHRWFDLIRTGSVNSVMGSPGNACQDKGGTWNSDWQLYPIPQTEITNDASLNQNPGY